MEKNIIIKKYPKCHLYMSLIKNARILVFNTHSSFQLTIEYKNDNYFIIYTLMNCKKYYLNFTTTIFEINGEYKELCHGTLTDNINNAELFIKDDENLLYWHTNNNNIPLTYYELHTYNNNKDCYSIKIILTIKQIINEESDIVIK